MSRLKISDYPPIVQSLLSEDRLPELGPGKPNRAVEAELKLLTPRMLFPQLDEESMALACISGLWLLHDFLDESHTISQEISTTAGSYWHAIMHRREPDAFNSKYWFRQVGVHPIFKSLAQEAHHLSPLEDANRWDPMNFVDLCEKHRGSGSEQETLLRKIQKKEWELLFDWCFRST